MQVSACGNEFPSGVFPDMTVNWHGKITPMSKPVCLGDDKPRRFDGLKQSYGTGTPCMNSPKVDIFGISLNGSREAEKLVDTSEGSIKLPIEAVQQYYTPSIATLETVRHSQGTRLQPLPGRYYR